MRSHVLGRQKFEGKALQGVSGEGCSRFVPFAVEGRLAAAQIVIVHARQIVMHQRIGMDAFDGQRSVQRSGLVHAVQAGTFQHQKAAQHLAAHHGIAHGLMQQVATGQPPVHMSGDAGLRVQKRRFEGLRPGLRIGRHALSPHPAAGCRLACRLRPA